MEAWREDTVFSFYHQIASTMPTDRPWSLEPAIYADIVAYFFSRNDFPTGDSELVVDTLREIWIQGKDGPAPVPSFSMVSVVACLERKSEVEYTLSSAAAAVRVRDPAESTGEAVEAAKAKPLGDTRFDLLRNVTYLKPEGMLGHRVEVKGFLIRDPKGDRINVSTLLSLDENCE